MTTTQTPQPTAPTGALPFFKNPSHDPWRCTCQECLLIDLRGQA